MVLETRLRSAKKKGKQIDMRCKSADSGVSVALNKTFRRNNTQSSQNEINDLEEEQLDFEPELDDSPENQPELEQHLEIYSDQSTVRNFDLDSCDVDSNYSATVDNCSISTISIAHRRDMLPIPKSNAEDGRHFEYLPIPSTASGSVRTTLDSSSEDDITDSEPEMHIDNDTQDDLATDQYDCQSSAGSVESEENSSAYSITQEEEDKLLEGDEGSTSDKESQENTVLIPTGLIKTCQIGNARITLPTFISNSYQEPQTKDLKRTKSVKAVEVKKKRKKWDLLYKPEDEITRVFLEDIGYISERDENMSCEDHNSTCEPSFGKLIVICNKDKITCEEPRGNSPRNDDSNFKLPLPPPKRPPTRPKRTVCSNMEPGKNLQIQVSNKQPEFAPKPYTFTASKDCNSMEDCMDDDNNMDALSLIASSIGADTVDDIANLDLLEEMTSSNQSEENHIEPFQDYNLEDRVKEWIQNVPNPNISSSSNHIQSDIPEIPAVLEPTSNISVMPPPVLVRGNPRINFKEIPIHFTGLCYYHYFFGKCSKPYCNLAHIVHIQKLIHKLQKGNPNDLLKSFHFSTRFEKFFKEVYPAFLTVFGLLKMQNELVTSIKDILKMEQIDSTEAVDMVVNALEKSGLSFLEAIEMISFNIGFLEHPVLADILLDLITRKYNISENWEVIKRIARAKGKIQPSIVKKILTRVTSVYPVNKELCLEIYNVIIKNNMTDLSQINEDILVPYRTVAGFQDAVSTTKSPPKAVIPHVHPITVHNSQEVLAAHIDQNLIRERERYERQVEGTTVRTSAYQTALNQESNYSEENYNYRNRETTSCDNRSHSSGSDDRYFTPTPMLNNFPKHPLNGTVSNRYYSRNDIFSPATPSTSNSPIESEASPNVALHFEPPSDISEYEPQNVRRRSDTQEDEITLTPTRPIFGKPSYRKDFHFDKSLHNLLPNCFENVNINERDVGKLNSVIKSRNGPEFLALLKYYKNPPTLQNFITMTIAHLKLCGDNIYEIFVDLIKSLETVKPDYAKDKHIKGIIEVIVMNLLFELERKGKWSIARNFLQLFCDWDSLISSKIFSKRHLTHIGRYIFLAKIFAKAKNFHCTYEILQCPNLKLLESPEVWTYFNNSHVDLEYRNAVLREFFEHGHHYYIIGVSDMYRRIYKFGAIHGYDARVHFNPMLIAIINEQQTSSLKYFYADIDIYYKTMDKNVLRAFTIMLAPQLSQDELFKLYNLCCEKQIYTLFTGTETSITVRNNMLDVELQLILNYYFYKISENRQLPTSDVKIHIKLLEVKPLYPKILQKCVRSIKEINEAIKRILRDNLKIIVNDEPGDQLTVVEILHEQVVKWRQCNQRWFSIYT